MPNGRSEPLFVQSTHPGTHRTAVIDEVVGSVWLYLMPPGGSRPDGDCWLANTVAHDEHRDRDSYRALGVPPPATPSMVTSGGVLVDPSAHAWQLCWSDDGEAVAAICDGQVRGFVCSPGRRSCARHLHADGPWGQAWDQHAFEHRFRRGGVR